MGQAFLEPLGRERRAMKTKMMGKSLGSSHIDFLRIQKNGPLKCLRRKKRILQEGGEAEYGGEHVRAHSSFRPVLAECRKAGST